MKKRIVKGLVAFVPAVFLVGSWFGVASAAECVSPDLSTNCKRTIQEALAVVAPGEYVFVYPGTYAENVSVDTAQVRVVGKGGWPGQVVISPATGVGVSLNAPQTRLSNVTIQGGETGVVVTATGAGAVIHEVIVRESAAGISVSADGVRVKNSSVRRIEGTGIEAAGADFVVRSTVVQQIGGQCVRVSGDGALFSKNRIMDCGQEGVTISGSAAQVFGNDIFVAGRGLLQVDGPGARIRNNTVKGGRAGSIRVVSDAPNVAKNSVSDCETGIEVYCSSCSGAQVRDNSVTGIYDCPGIFVKADSAGMKVRDNTSWGNSEEGFDLTGVGMVVLKNTAFDNGRDGIRVGFSSAGIQLLDNRTDSNARNGIRIDSGAVDTVIERNRACCNGDVDYFDAGTGTILGTGGKRNYFGTTGP